MTYQTVKYPREPGEYMDFLFTSIPRLFVFGKRQGNGRLRLDVGTKAILLLNRIYDLNLVQMPISELFLPRKMTSPYPFYRSPGGILGDAVARCCDTLHTDEKGASDNKTVRC